MNKSYEVHRTERGLSIWMKDGLQTFTDKEALKLAQTIISNMVLEPPPINVVINNYGNNCVTSRPTLDGDIMLTIDDLVTKAYNRHGSLFRALNNQNPTKR